MLGIGPTNFPYFCSAALYAEIIVIAAKKSRFHRRVLQVPIRDDWRIALRGPRGVPPTNMLAGTELSTVFGPWTRRTCLGETRKRASISMWSGIWQGARYAKSLGSRWKRCKMIVWEFQTFRIIDFLWTPKLFKAFPRTELRKNMRLKNFTQRKCGTIATMGYIEDIYDALQSLAASELDQAGDNNDSHTNNSDDATTFYLSRSPFCMAFWFTNLFMIICKMSDGIFDNFIP